MSVKHCVHVLLLLVLVVLSLLVLLGCVVKGSKEEGIPSDMRD